MFRQGQYIISDFFSKLHLHPCIYYLRFVRFHTVSACSLSDILSNVLAHIIGHWGLDGRHVRLLSGFSETWPL